MFWVFFPRSPTFFLHSGIINNLHLLNVLNYEAVSVSLCVHSVVRLPACVVEGKKNPSLLYFILILPLHFFALPPSLRKYHIVEIYFAVQ